MFLAAESGLWWLWDHLTPLTISRRSSPAGASAAVPALRRHGWVLCHREWETLTSFLRGRIQANWEAWDNWVTRYLWSVQPLFLHVVEALLQPEKPKPGEIACVSGFIGLHHRSVEKGFQQPPGWAY